MRDEQDHEIDLREYIEIAVKRKKIVFGVLFTAVFFAAVWSVLSPRIYEISVVLGPPIMLAADGAVKDLDSTMNMKAKIESGAFNTKIISELNIPEKELKFDVSQLRDTKVIKVSLRWTTEQADIGKKTLAKLVEALNLQYADYIKNWLSRVENQIQVALSQIGRKENEIKGKSEQLKIMTERERQYSDDIREAKINSEKLAANRTALFERKENKDDVTALLYAATIQQNISYFAQLQDELSKARIEKEKITNGIADLKNGINEDRIGIENLRLSLGDMRNIEVIQEPLVSLRPIGPKKAQNILIAAMAGLIVGLCSALFIEHWKSSAA